MDRNAGQPEPPTRLRLPEADTVRGRLPRHDLPDARAFASLSSQNGDPPTIACFFVADPVRPAIGSVPLEAGRDTSLEKVGPDNRKPWNCLDAAAASARIAGERGRSRHN